MKIIKRFNHYQIQGQVLGHSQKMKQFKIKRIKDWERVARAGPSGHCLFLLNSEGDG